MTANDLAPLLPFVLIALVFYFLVLRPSRRRQSEYRATQQALEAGSRVMLSSGIHGELVALGDDTTVQLRVAPDVVLTVERAAIARVFTDDAVGDQSPVDAPNDQKDA